MPLKRPLQPIYIDGNGSPRFVSNKIVEYVLTRAHEVGVDMNHLASLNSLFETEDYEQFAQLVGYSVSGFGDLSYASEETVKEADAEAARLLKREEDTLMPIIKLKRGDKEWYLDFSTISDAPNTYGLTLEELKKHVAETAAERALEELKERLKRVEARGTSGHHDRSVRDTIGYNRAGVGETCLTIDQMIDMYCERKGDIKGHKHPNDDICKLCHPGSVQK